MNFIHRQKLEPSKSHSENIVWFLNGKSNATIGFTFKLQLLFKHSPTPKEGMRSLPLNQI